MNSLSAISTDLFQYDPDGKVIKFLYDGFLTPELVGRITLTLATTPTAIRGNNRDSASGEQPLSTEIYRDKISL